MKRPNKLKLQQFQQLFQLRMQHYPVVGLLPQSQHQEPSRPRLSCDQGDAASNVFEKWHRLIAQSAKRFDNRLTT
jgi:hypothetical protein